MYIDWPDTIYIYILDGPDTSLRRYGRLSFEAIEHWHSFYDLVCVYRDNLKHSA